MSALTEEEKMFVVSQFAQFRTHAQVIEAVKETFAKEIGFTNVRAYDPASPYFSAGDRFRALHDEMRKAFIQNVSDIPIANQSFRLAILQQGVVASVQAGKWATAAALAEQAAKEVGGVLTNQRNVSFENKGRARDMTPDERREALMGMISDRLEQLASDKGSATVQ